MKAFVTGSTGLLGHHIVRTLLQDGHRVRALVRSDSKADRVLADLDVETVRGDLAEVAGCAARLQDDTLRAEVAWFRRTGAVAS